MKEKISITLDKRILREVDQTIDGVKVRNRSQAIESVLDKVLGVNRVAVILCGGLPAKLKIGNTYRPLVEIKEHTLIERNVEKLKKYNFNEIFIIARKEILSKIMNVLGDGSKYNIKLNYVEDYGNDTAESIKILKDKIKTSFLVVPGDNEFEMDLGNFWRSHLRNKCVMTLALTTSRNPAKISIVHAEGNKIKEFEHYKEKKHSKSGLVWSGTYMAEPEFFDYIKEKDSSTELNVVPKILKNDLLYGYIFSGYWFNIHTENDLKEVKKALSSD